MAAMEMEKGKLKRTRKPRGPYFSYLSSPTKLIPQRTLYRQNQNHKRLLYDSDKVCDVINVDDEVVDVVVDVQCEVDEEIEINLSDKFSISAEEEWSINKKLLSRLANLGG